MNRHITRESEMLRKARVKLGYSQQQVATMAGMQIRQYQRFEYGEREVYDICGWDEGLNYKVPATVRTRGSETILFFDLDNYIGTEPRKNVVQEEPTASETKASSVDEDDETRGIFYAPDDDAPQEITDTEEIEKKLRAIAEHEKRNFGTPAFEHDSNVRLPAIDDNNEWEVMAEALVLGDDHRVDDEIVEAMQDSMLEAMISAEGSSDDGEQHATDQ